MVGEWDDGHQRRIEDGGGASRCKKRLSFEIRIWYSNQPQQRFRQPTTPVTQCIQLRYVPVASCWLERWDFVDIDFLHALELLPYQIACQLLLLSSIVRHLLFVSSVFWREFFARFFLITAKLCVIQQHTCRRCQTEAKADSVMAMCDVNESFVQESVMNMTQLTESIDSLDSTHSFAPKSLLYRTYCIHVCQTDPKNKPASCENTGDRDQALLMLGRRYQTSCLKPTLLPSVAPRTTVARWWLKVPLASSCIKINFNVFRVLWQVLGPDRRTNKKEGVRDSGQQVRPGVNSYSLLSLKFLFFS